MKKLIILVLLIFLVSCSPQKTVQIGMIVSTTGKYSPLLITARNGAQLAVEQINRNSNTKIELQVVDDESNTAKILPETRKLVKDGIEIFVLAVTSASYARVQEYLNSEDVIALSATVSSDSFSGVDDNLIRLVANVSDYAEKLGEYALKEKVNKTVVVYDTNNLEYAEKLYPMYSSVTEQGNTGAQVQLLPFNSLEAPSFKSIGKQIVQHSPDAVLIIASPFHAAMISQHIYGHQFLRLYAPWAISDELIENGGRSVEGAIFYLNSSFTKVSSEMKNFQEAYKKRFSAEPSYQSLSHYDAINILHKVITSVDSAGAGPIKKELLSQGKFQGVEKNYNFDRYGDSSFSLTPHTIRNGRVKKLEE